MELERLHYVGQLNSGVGASRLFTLYTTDSIASITAPGYFSDPKRQIGVGDQILVFYQYAGASYVRHLGVTSIDGGVVQTSQILDSGVTSLSDTISALTSRVSVLESNTGAPTQTYPGQLQFTSSASSVDEGGTTTIRINRVNGLTGSVSCALSWSALN